MPFRDAVERIRERFHDGLITEREYALALYEAACEYYNSLEKEADNA